MSKVDFKKSLKEFYSAPAEAFGIVDVPAMNFLMIDGFGDPNTSPDYADALKTVYPVAYGLKFLSKSRDLDYVVPPLEALWWADDWDSFVKRHKDDWYWTVMLMTPDWISQDDVEAIIASTQKKQLPAIDRLRLETFLEGMCVQTLYTGSYDDEADTLAQLHDHWIPDNGFRETGKHHEIYLSDPRRTAPRNLKTILRQPITAR